MSVTMAASFSLAALATSSCFLAPFTHFSRVGNRSLILTVFIGLCFPTHEFDHQLTASLWIQIPSLHVSRKLDFRVF